MADGWIAGVVVAVVVVFLLLILSCSSFWIVQECEFIVIERFGRFHSILDSGFHITIPFIDSPRNFPWQRASLAVDGNIMDVPETSYRIDCREAVFHFSPMEVYTKDTLLLEVNCLMYYRISDVRKANYEVDDLQNALTAAAQTQIKEAFGQMTFHEALECQEFINEYLVKEFSVLFEKWGVEVHRMELISLNPGRSDYLTTKAMKLQMIAERKRRGEFIKFEGSKAAQNIRAEGTKRVSQLIGIAEQEATKKRSEGAAAATVLLAQAEKSSLDAINKVSSNEGTSLSDFFLTKQFIDFFRKVAKSTRSSKIVIPFEPNFFSGSLFKSVSLAFGRKAKPVTDFVKPTNKFGDLD